MDFINTNSVYIKIEAMKRVRNNQLDPSITIKLSLIMDLIKQNNNGKKITLTNEEAMVYNELIMRGYIR